MELEVLGEAAGTAIQEVLGEGAPFAAASPVVEPAHIATPEVPAGSVEPQEAAGTAIQEVLSAGVPHAAASPHGSAEPHAGAGNAIQEAIDCALSLAQGGDIDEAVAVVRCECEQAPASALSSTYQALVEAYLRVQRPESASRLLTEVQRRNPTQPVVPSVCQEAVLSALLQAQQTTHACELISVMCAAGAVPSDAVFNSVLDASVRARTYSQAWDVLELLLKHQRHADKYFVSILTKNLETSSDRRFVRRGLNLVDRFVEQQRGDVDEIVFNSLLNVLGQIGDMQRLQQTLSKMAEYNVAPSAVTYGTVVKAYGRAHDIDAVLKVWQEMRSRNLGVNPVTCGCVLDACVKCGDIDKAMGIFQEMRLQGLHRNTVLYATLIKGLAKVRNLMGAVHLYQEMRVEAVPCNLVTFNSLMDVCVRCGDLQTAALFLQDMMQMGIQPDLITFSTLIKGYSHIGEVPKALALARELKSRGLKCDEIMFNSLIDGCAKAHQLQEGLDVFKEMLVSRVAPSNITFSILVKLHFEVGCVAEAFQLVEDMAPKYHCVPSRIVYTVLFRCCGQHGGASLSHGAALLTELASKRNSKLPDQGMVSAVLSGCVQHAQFDIATRLVIDFAANNARRGGSLLSQDVLKSLFEAFGAKDEARGQELLEHLKRRCFPSASQFEAALAEGRKNAGIGSAVAFPGGPTPISPVAAMGGASIHVPNTFDAYASPYAQWSHPGPYPQQPCAGNMYPSYDPAYQQLQPGYYSSYPPVQYSSCPPPGVAPQMQCGMLPVQTPPTLPLAGPPGPAPQTPAPLLADPSTPPPPQPPAAEPQIVLAKPGASTKRRPRVVDKENAAPSLNIQPSNDPKKNGLQQHGAPRNAPMNRRQAI